MLIQKIPLRAFIAVTSLLITVGSPDLQACAGGDDECNCVAFDTVLWPSTDTRAMLAMLIFSPELENSITAPYNDQNNMLALGSVATDANSQTNTTALTAKEQVRQLLLSLQPDPAEVDKILLQFPTLDSHDYTEREKIRLLQPVLSSIKENNDLTPADKISLTCMALDAPCGTAPVTITADYTNYLSGRNAFYAADYENAEKNFAALTQANTAWIKETAQYNLIRVYLRKALVLDEYGNTDISKRDAASADKALQAINQYLQLYPAGRYATSAEGLKRRAYWLKGDTTTMMASYNPVEKTLQNNPALINEIDRFAVFPDGYYTSNDNKTEENPAANIAWNSPLIAVAQIMVHLRSGSEWKPVPLPDLLAHEKIFTDAGYSEAFRFLVLATEFYSNKNYQLVIEKTEDWQDIAKKPSYIAYSILTLRAYAFEALSQWSQSAALWSAIRSMNTSPLFKAYTEAAQAADLELAGNLPALFAKDSPVTNTSYRQAVIQQSASADILTLILSLEHISADEKQLAATTLLRKDMVSANFSKLAEHYKNYTGLLPDNKNWCDVVATETLDYSCKNPAAAIDNLASTKPSADSRLCLTVWLQQCGSVTSSTGIGTDEIHTLAGKPIIHGHYTNDGFNKKIQESNIFQQVLDDPKATTDQRAYALYRSLQCFYHNDDYHSYGYCEGLGDRADYPIEKRRAWFNELKTRYKSTPWAAAQRVYW